MLFSKLGYFQEYALERQKAQIPSDELLQNTFKEAIIAQFILQPITSFYLFPVFSYFGSPGIFEPLPGVAALTFQFSVCYLFNSTFFYWSHRMLHLPWFYKRVHKQHHEYKGTIGFAAEYASPWEQLLSNQLPTVGGALFFGFHPLVWFTWLFCRLVQTYEAHSGYCFEGTWLATFGLLHPHDSRWHNSHHMDNDGNFGSLFWDYFGNTISPALTKSEEKRLASKGTKTH